jgi:hypothetical protein
MWWQHSPHCWHSNTIVLPFPGYRIVLSLPIIEPYYLTIAEHIPRRRDVVNGIFSCIIRLSDLSWVMRVDLKSCVGYKKIPKG